MEQSDAVADHCNAVLIAGFNDIVISDGTARLSDIAYTALVGAFDIVTEREECIRAERYTCILRDPFLLLMTLSRSARPSSFLNGRFRTFGF